MSRTKRSRWLREGVFAAALLSGSVIAGGAFTGSSYAQPDAPQSEAPAFDVVSVKPSGSTRIHLAPGESFTFSSRSFQYSPGRLTCDQTLMGFLMEAYPVTRDWQISGPNWLNDEKYEFAAIMPAETTRETGRLMLRTMLADRFGLKLHREPKEMPVYALVAGKAGFKLHEVPNPGTYDTRHESGLFAATAMPMPRLADFLSHVADRPVVDMTGLKGIYKIELKWEPDYEEARDGTGQIDRGVLAVLEAKLGLKLEARKMPFEALVIDRIQKTPTPN